MISFLVFCEQSSFEPTWSSSKGALKLVDIGSAIKNDLSEKALAQWRQSGGWHDGVVAVETMFNSRAGKAVEAQRQ